MEVLRIREPVGLLFLPLGKKRFGKEKIIVGLWAPRTPTRGRGAGRRKESPLFLFVKGEGSEFRFTKKGKRGL